MGQRTMTVRGRVCLEAFTELDVALANAGTSHNFKGRGLGCIVDLTYVSAAFANNFVWQDSEDYTYTDHQAICMEIKGESSSKKLSQNAGWFTRR